MQINKITGQVTVTHVDILIEVGRSLNPADDRAEVLARFIQGIDWATSDERPASQAGDPLSTGPEIDPMSRVHAVPRNVQVDFLEGSDRGRNLYTDQSIGGLSFLLGVSVWAAVKQAIASVSRGHVPDLNLPATTEEVLRCLTQLVASESTRQAEGGRSD